jgi:hypothetical protein
MFIVCVYITLLHQNYIVRFFVYTKFPTLFVHSNVVRENCYGLADCLAFNKITVIVFEFYYDIYIKNSLNSMINVYFLYLYMYRYTHTHTCMCVCV